MQTDKITYFMSLINSQCDNALNNAKYLNMTADEVIQTYENLKLPPPIKIKKNTWSGGLIDHGWGPTDRGWGNGYVRIVEGHPFYGMDYMDIPVSVHGGITFGNHIMDDSRWPDGYWIGFDTAHHSDNLQRWPKESVLSETKDLFAQVYHLK